MQFCANNPDTLLEAGKLVQDQCDYVDINFGYTPPPQKSPLALFHINVGLELVHIILGFV